MKYYIVALFDKDSYKTITPIQKNISKKFRANRNSPQPYITLEVLENPNMDKLYSIVEKVIKPYKKFKVELCNDVSINEAQKTVNLSILNEGYIKKISRNLNDTLALHGVHTKDGINNLSISLGNVNYSNKERKYSNDIACDLIRKDGKNLTLKIDSFEVWKISNNRKETPIKSYELKTF
ncbi:MAG: hypothetical protein PUE01_08430 [Clostridiaceae bacterium]|nr:hypothetical protein [Clostridiaceae bacterium]